MQNYRQKSDVVWTIFPLQIWWLNTWSIVFFRQADYAQSYISIEVRTQLKRLWQGLWVYQRQSVYTFSWCQKIV